MKALKPLRQTSAAGCQMPGAGCRMPSAPRPSDFGLHSSFVILLLTVCLARAQTNPVALVHDPVTRTLAASGDFDGDGRTDLVLLDAASGAARVAYQTVPGTFAWQAPLATGVSNLTGAAIGRILQTNRLALAVTAPEANRVNVLSLTGTPLVPASAFPARLGAATVVAFDIGGGVNTPHEDLLVATRWNSPPTATAIETLRSTGSAFSPLSATALSRPGGFANPVVLKAGASVMGGVMLDGPLDSTFEVWWAPLSAPAVVLSHGSFPAGSQFVHARFAAGQPLVQFLFYQPGSTNLYLRQVLEPVPGTFTLGVPATFSLAFTIDQVAVLPGTNQTRLLVTHAGGTRQRVYTFDGTNAPASIQQLDAEPGERFTAGVPVNASDFVSFNGHAATGETTSTRLHTWNGSTFTPGPKLAVPGLRRANLTGNVLLFRHEPFVTPNPQLLKTLNAADWSRDFALTGAPAVVTVKRESFGSSASGLANPNTVALGQAPALTGHGLPNQYTTSLSVFSLAPAVGDENAEVALNPPPGQYPAAITATLTPTDPAHSVFFRLGTAAAWQAYTGPLVLWTNTTLQYYGRTPAGLNSPIRTVAFHFDQAAGTQDSDGDGVPDYVEIAKGLDPNAGKDSDGDGYSDLDELVAGSNPASAASVPPPAYVRLDERGFFNLILTPLPVNGMSDTRTLAATGAIVRAYSLPGSLLGAQTTTNLFLAGVSNSAARLTNVAVSAAERLHVAATEEHFDLQTTGADKRIGRELLGLYDLPPAPPFEVSYTYAGGNLATEAANWIASAQAAAASNARPQIRRQLTSLDSLAALLTERKLADILLSRGTNWATNITLFPARPADAGRLPLTPAALSAVEHRLSPALPGYLPHHVHSNLLWRVNFDPVPGITLLAALADDVYALSSASNNTAPGKYPSPVNVLRDFLQTGALQSNYAAGTFLTSAQLTAAAAVVPVLLAAVPPRPTTNLLVRVRPDSFTSPHATIVERSSAPFTPFYLFNAEGGRFDFPDAFRLLVGSVVGVFGYTDVTNRFFPTNNIEVITAGVSSLPVVSDPDLNGNLLIDSWEEFFGGLSGNPFADSDGDGYTDLQEMFDGSDPLDGLNIPAGPPLPFAAPVLEITPDGAVIRIRFYWPASAIGKIVWGVRGAATLDGPFTDLLATPPTWLGGNHFEVTVPAPGTPLGFYFLTLKLP